MDSYYNLHNSIFIILLLTASSLSACNSTPTNENPSHILISSIKCTDPRPQICSKELRAVCAAKQDGTAITYSTGCMACSDNNVLSYSNGKCK